MEAKQQRQFERIKVSVEATFGILIPEATFQPAQFKATVSDLSERGAMVLVKLDPDTYRQMLHKSRYCRITFAEKGLPVKLIGRAVWIQPQGKVDEIFYKIGLFFEDCPIHVVEQLRRYVSGKNNPSAISAP